MTTIPAKSNPRRPRLPPRPRRGCGRSEYDEASLDKLMVSTVLLCYALLALVLFCCVLLLFRLDRNGRLVTKVHVLNNLKVIVHLIDEFFWNCGIARREGIIVIILLLCYYCTHWYIVAVIVLIAIMSLIDIIAIDRFTLISVFPITFGSINVLQLQTGLKIWEISSVLPCERDGWLSLGRPILLMLMSMKLRRDRVNRSCLTIWGPGLGCTLNTNPSCSTVFSNNHNSCSNNRNTSQ